MTQVAAAPDAAKSNRAAAILASGARAAATQMQPINFAIGLATIENAMLASIPAHECKALPNISTRR